MGRDAAGVIGIRLARQGDMVVGMSVVEPDADVLVLTETGYGKRVPLTEFRRKHRGGQGVGLISLEGRKTGDVAAVQQVTEADEELLLISAGGQVIRTETNTINRYSSSARGSSSCASPRATGSWRSPRSAPDLRSATAWATMATPHRRGPHQPGRPARDIGMRGG